MSLASCSSKSKSPKNDLEKMNLKGEVMALIDGRYTFYLFDNSGNLIRHFSKLDNGEIEETIYYYNNIGLLDKTMDNKTSSHYFYDEKNNLKSRIDSLNTMNSFHYFFYDDNNLLIKDSNKTKITGYDPLIYINHYFYKKGILDYVMYKGAIDESIVIKYNDGLVISSESKGNKSTYTYLYDSKGNWIQRKELEDGSEEIKSYLYKGDDIDGALKNWENIPYYSENNAIVSSDNNSNSSNSDNLTSAQNTQEKRKCYSCNGTGKCSKCMKAFRVHYWAGKGPGWKDENETRPGKIMCDDCHGAGVIYGRHPYGEDPEYKKCYVSACNNGWKNCPECNYNGNSNNLGQCKKCNGSGFDR